MKHSQTYITATVLLSSLLAGCGAKTPSATPMVRVVPPQVSEQLIAAAGAIEGSLRQLALTKRTYSLPTINTAPLITPEGGMGGTIDLNWIGPIAPLIKKLSDATDYKIKVLGKTPAIPIVVSIAQKNMVIADVFKDAALQINKRATIMIYPTSRIVELRYH